MSKLQRHQHRVLPGGGVVVFPPSHRREAVLLIQGDGGGIGGPDLQHEAGQALPAEAGQGGHSGCAAASSDREALNMNFRITPMTAAHLPAVAALEKACFPAGWVV